MSGEDGEGLRIDDESEGGGSSEDGDEEEEAWEDANDDVILPPFTGRSGLQVEAPGDLMPLSFFRLFFTQAVIEKIVIETNRFAVQAGGQPQRRAARLRSRVELTNSSLFVFLGLFFLMGVAKRPQVAMYWSKDPLVGCPAFGKYMKRNRWEIIMSCLHFNDNDQYDHTDPNRDPLFKVRPLLDLLVERFKHVYIPGRELSVDEELLKWKGRLSFRQYIPSKRARFGIKTFFMWEQRLSP